MVTTDRGQRMSAEIAEQPAVFQRIIDESSPAIREVAARLRDRPPLFVLLAGRGTSDHAALYAKYLIEVRLGIPCGLASPSTVTAYESTMAMRGGLFLAVSQSGESPDLVASLMAAKAGGAITIAVTNSPHSPLATNADHHLDVNAGPELAVAATKTYTAELLTFFLLIESWRTDTPQAVVPGSTLERLVTAADEVASDTTTSRHLADRLHGIRRLILTARGYSYPTAAEAALKMVETSYISAHAYSGADLLHGPVAMVSQDFPVVAIIPKGPASASMRDVVAKVSLRSKQVIVLSDAVERFDGVRQIALPSGLAEELHPLVDIILLQKVALELSLLAGQDPDGPRGLLKITQTL